MQYDHLSPDLYAYEPGLLLYQLLKFNTQIHHTIHFILCRIYTKLKFLACITFSLNR